MVWEQCGGGSGVVVGAVGTTELYLRPGGQKDEERNTQAQALQHIGDVVPNVLSVVLIPGGLIVPDVVDRHVVLPCRRVLFWRVS